MGKRSDFEKIVKSQYLTPEAAVLPLIPFLPKGGFRFAEPCAGDGRLACHIEKHTNGQAALLTDIDPGGAARTANERFYGAFRNDITQKDALDITESDLTDIDYIITNPPWDRDKKSGHILHRLIGHLGQLRPTWFLFDADWMHTIQAQPYLIRCTHIVSVGRVKWMPGTGQTGKDNAAWYCFGLDRATSQPTRFYGRGIQP